MKKLSQIQNQKVVIRSSGESNVRVDFQCRVIFTYVRACVKFTFANKIEAIHKRSLVGVKVEVDVFRPVARIFLRVGAILRGDRANEDGGASI